MDIRWMQFEELLAGVSQQFTGCGIDIENRLGLQIDDHHCVVIVLEYLAIALFRR